MIKVSALVIAAFLGSSDLNVTDKGFGYAVVVRGAVEMKRLPRSQGNVEPWSEATTDSCGFARLTYQEVNATFVSTGRIERKKKSSFYHLTGHWCEISHALLDPGNRATLLIIYRKWHGKKYILTYTDVYNDNDGVPYVVDRSFVALAGLEESVTSLAQGNDNRACFPPEYVPERLLDQPSSMVIDDSGHHCATKGVKLSAFLLPANNSLQLP